MTYSRYLDAEYKINEGLIRVGLSLERERKGPKDPFARMEEMADFLDALGNPQNGLKAVHVAGTSGKGSVAAAVAGILSSAGLRVGLHISPYLQSATEKIWIDGKFISAEEFADLVDWVMPVAAPRVRPETPASIHGMASVAIALEAFRRARVDAIVFEVGCGGRFDLTSFVQTEVAIVTNVGLDHEVSLGPTLEQIAWHKAGVARPKKPLITGASDEAIGPIIEEAERVGADLVRIPNLGDKRAQNHAIAREAARQFAGRVGLDLEPADLEQGLCSVTLAGRTEVMPGGGPRVIIDGAHNPEKIAFAVEHAFQDAGVPRVGAPRVGVIGFLGTKAKPEIVRPLQGKLDFVVATEPKVYAKTSCPTAETCALFRQAGIPTEEVPDMFAALARAEQIAGPKGTVLVTGSFYLVGDMREKWYPKRDVVLGRSSWPQQGIPEK